MLNMRIAHNSAFTDVLAARLKLRFYKDYPIAVREKQGSESRQKECYRNEAHIAGDEGR